MHLLALGTIISHKDVATSNSLFQKTILSEKTLRVPMTVVQDLGV